MNNNIGENGNQVDSHFGDGGNENNDEADSTQTDDDSINGGNQQYDTWSDDSVANNDDNNYQLNGQPGIDDLSNAETDTDTEPGDDDIQWNGDNVVDQYGYQSNESIYVNDNPFTIERAISDLERIVVDNHWRLGCYDDDCRCAIHLNYSYVANYLSHTFIEEFSENMRRISEARTRWLWFKEEKDLKPLIMQLNEILAFRDSMRDDMPVEMNNFHNVILHSGHKIQQRLDELWLTHLNNSLASVIIPNRVITQEGFKSIVGQFLESVYYTIITKLFAHVKEIVNMMRDIPNVEFPTMHIFNQIPALRAHLMTELRQTSLAQLAYKRAVWRYYYPLVEERVGGSWTIYSETMIRNMANNPRDKRYDQHKTVKQILVGHRIGPLTSYESDVVNMAEMSDRENGYRRLEQIQMIQEDLSAVYPLDQQLPIIPYFECIINGIY